MTSSTRMRAAVRTWSTGAILGLCVVGSATPVEGVVRFGAFRNGGTQVDTTGLQYIGAEWTNRDLRPLTKKWWGAADSVVSSNCAAGGEVTFNLTSAPDSSLNAYFPQNIPAWVDSVQRVVERYDGDGIMDMPNLVCPVKYWHVIEEDTFWKDEVDAYLAFLAITRAAVKSADPDGKIVLMGISSDNCGSAAHWSGAVTARPPGFRLIPEDSLSRFYLRTQRLLHEGDYDVVDVHCYEVESVLRGKFNWLRSLMADPTIPIWVYEAGGPYQTRAQGYTDTLNSYVLVRGFAEAFANGAGRYTNSYRPPVPANWDGTESFQNVALRRRLGNGVTEPKPSFETYRLLTEKIGGFTAAADQSDRTGTDERDYLYTMRFDMPNGPVFIAWCPLDIRTLRLSATTSTVTVTHPITRAGDTADDAVVEYVAVVDGIATISVGAEPLIIEGSQAALLTDVQPAPNPSERVPALHVTLGPIPARGSLRLSWTNAKDAAVSVRVHSLDGRLVQSMSFPSRADGGANVAMWDLRDAEGRAVPAGVYVLAYREERDARWTARKVSVLR